jgi:chemotaxis protein methyltransferase CheR
MEFVEHNLVTDDAFLETQLLICRNVLIYFGAALQARALDLFERSLQRGGFLVLGSAESILGRDDTWAPLQAELRIFRKTMARAK